MTILALAAALLMLAGPLRAVDKPADDVGNYTVTWIGNSIPTGHISVDERAHMPSSNWGIEVSADGRVYAGGVNEAGHAISVYKDGDLESPFVPKAGTGDNCWNWGTSNRGAVTFDDRFMYSVSGCGKVHKWERKPPYTKVRVMVDIGLPAAEAIVKFGKMYLLGLDNGEIQIRQLDDDYTLIRSFTVPGAYDIAIESEDSIWVSLGGGNVDLDGARRRPENKVRRYDAAGNRLDPTLEGFGNLMGISIGHDGRLLVCDDGPAKQVIFYDISEPTGAKVTRRFGEPGGIYAGRRGVLDNDLQLFDVQDADTDAAGNLYTLFSQSRWTQGTSGGNMIRAYSPEGQKLWELSSQMWTGTASVLPSTDGAEIYGVEEVFVLDSTAGPGDPDWKLYAISKDDVSNPNDFREVNAFNGRPFRGSAEMRDIGGKRVVFRQGMYSGTAQKEKGYDLLVFEDRPSMISHHRGTLTGNGFAWYPDAEGNVWEGNGPGGKIRMHRFVRYDARDCPQYEVAAEYDRPDELEYVARLHYNVATDVMYLSGYRPDQRNGLPWNVTGTHVCRYDNWKTGNRTARYTAELPFDQNPGRSLPPKTLYIAGDYIFTVAVRPDVQGIHQKVTILDVHTGEKVGTMSASDKFFGLGWVDITKGLIAYQRSNGEYIIIVEDNGYAKNVIYRWRPDDEFQSVPADVNEDYQMRRMR